MGAEGTQSGGVRFCHGTTAMASKLAGTLKSNCDERFPFSRWFDDFKTIVYGLEADGHATA
jgi:hypothetical protein